MNRALLIAENPRGNNEPGSEMKRKGRRRRNRKKGDSLIPPISTSKFPGRGDRHVAQDLYIAIRCTWAEGSIRRVVLANWAGDCILDQKLHQDNFFQAREKVSKKIEGKVLIGHGLDCCLYYLQIQHPWANLRDGASHLPFMKEVTDPLTVMILPRSIEELSLEILNRQIPSSPSSDNLKEEAKACMDLYRAVRYDWENAITKLIQQKERQRGVKLGQQVLLTNVSEDSVQYGDQYSSTRETCFAGCEAYKTVGKESNLLESAEDQSTRALTDVTQEDLTLSARDDLSINTKHPEQSIWMTQDNATLHGSKKASGFWGTWLPKPPPPQESTHPIDADDWLCAENAVNIRRADEREETICAHLPSALLNDSFSTEAESDHERLVREETSHFVEGTDWLEDDTSSRKLCGRGDDKPRRSRSRGYN